MMKKSKNLKKGQKSTFCEKGRKRPVLGLFPHIGPGTEKQGGFTKLQEIGAYFKSQRRAMGKLAKKGPILETFFGAPGAFFGPKNRRFFVFFRVFLTSIFDAFSTLLRFLKIFKVYKIIINKRVNFNKIPSLLCYLYCSLLFPL